MATMQANIDGMYFAPGSSARSAARLCGDADALRLVGDDGVALLGPLPLEALEISPRVGNTPRFVRFAAGGAFETADNAAIDALLARRHPRHGLAHRLESRLRYVVIGVLVTAAFVFGVARYGVPAFAKVAAESLPPSAMTRLGDGVLDVLDRQLLEPSALPPAEQERLRRLFAPYMAKAAAGVPIRLEFRDAGKSIGPNALALPSGVVVFTDQLVRLMEKEPNAADAALIGILAHEIGHIEHRHALRQSIQGSTLGLAVMVLTGDVSSVSSLIAAIPVVLTELGYSREFEFEADRHAAGVLRQNGMNPAALGHSLQRLEQAHGAENCADEEKSGPGSCHEAAWWRYLSTHPPTAERIRRLEAFSDRAR